MSEPSDTGNIPPGLTEWQREALRQPGRRIVTMAPRATSKSAAIVSSLRFRAESEGEWAGPERSDSHLLWILRQCRSWRGLRYLLFGWEFRRPIRCDESRRCMRATVWGTVCEWHLSDEFEHKAERRKEPGT